VTDVAVHAPRAAAPAAAADFEIIPRKGLPIVAVVLVATIVAIAVNKLWPLEFLHIVFGAGWTVVDLFVGLILGPILGSLAIPARIELTKKLMPKMALLMPTLVLLAVMNFVAASGATSSIILLASRDTMTLSLMALELSSNAVGNREAASILSIFIILFTVTGALLVRYFGRRFGVRHEIHAPGGPATTVR